jgi:hypothetical protein
MAVSADTDARRDALVERMLAAKLGLMDLATIHIGERLGFYTALAKEPGLTSSELAQRTGTDERSVREWLECQAVGELLEVDDPAAAPGERRYTLPRRHGRRRRPLRRRRPRGTGGDQPPGVHPPALRRVAPRNAGRPRAPAG